MKKNEKTLNYVKILLDTIDNSLVKKNIKQLIKDYEKQVRRTKTIIDRTDKQEIHVLKLNEELEDHKNNLEQKVKEGVQDIMNIKSINHDLDSLIHTFDTFVIASRTDLNGVITYASKAYEKISGYKVEELVGKEHNIVRHPDMPASAFKDMWNTIEEEKTWIGEVLNLKKDGGFYWVKATISPYYDKYDQHIGYSSIGLDITAQKEVEVLNNQVTNLLNSVVQGFLSFDKKLCIEKTYSKECLNIFDTDDIADLNIADILFGNDSIKKDLFEDAISKVVDNDENMIKEMLLSLLPTEHILNNKDIQIEYKHLLNDKFILVLTDITATKELEHRIKEQNQYQKMIVSVASNQNDFINIKLDFEVFIKNPSCDLKVLQRELHTFKGVFAQKEMIYIVNSIHDLETKISDIVDISEVLKIFHAQKLGDVFQKDLEIIASTLGDEFIGSSHNINIDKKTIDELESKIKQLNPQNIEESLKDILYDFKIFKYETVYSMLKNYPVSVKQIAQKLEKEIYPLEIEGDELLNIDTRFKPLMQSFIHLFNNCVDHGIEDMDTRVENEKDEIGTICCKFIQNNNDLQIIISDDGAGIDIEKLSQSALKKDIITSDELKNMDKDEISMLVFSDSLSTKDEVSTISGRGVGMSAVKSEIDKLNGKIEIKNTIGLGVEFIFIVPLEN